MSRLTIDITMSLDGDVAGPNPSMDDPLGVGGDGAWEDDPNARGAQQYLRAGLADTLQVHVAPLLLGSGTRLLDGLGDAPPALTVDRVVASPAVTHVRYRVG